MQEIAEQFPDMEAADASGNPLAHIYRFFERVGQANPFGTGPFFQFEFPEDQEKETKMSSLVVETTINGVKHKDVKFKEPSSHVNGSLQSYKLVKNNEVIQDYQRPEDFSILHGLPRQLRRDKAYVRPTLLIEEYIKLVNYHIHDQYQQGNIIVDINHPQLDVPYGYSPTVFMRNFFQIIINPPA